MNHRDGTGLVNNLSREHHIQTRLVPILRRFTDQQLAAFEWLWGDVASFQREPASGIHPGGDLRRCRPMMKTL